MWLAYLCQMQIPVKKSVSDLKQFLLSQYFYDGLKITFGVVFPSLVCYKLGALETGITVSLGALFVSITDNPGAIAHKRNAMLAANFFIFLMALVIGFTNRNGYVLAIEIPVFCFLFSMLTVYGARASAVGIAALLVLVVTIDRHLPPMETLLHAVFLLMGGIWYLIFSQLVAQVMPYRPAEQTLGECIHEIAEYIRIKAAFYDSRTDIEANHNKLIDQQILVIQGQENVREILYKTRKLLKDSSAQGNKLIMTFIDVVDLYEHAMESHQNYELLHQEFDESKILVNYRNTIRNLAEELEYIGTCIHNHDVPHKFPMTSDLLFGIKSQLDALDQKGINTISLKKILVNLRNMAQRIEQIYNYQKSKPTLPDFRRKELNSFTSHQRLDWELFRENLTFSSAVFRHSFRVSIVCLLAFVFARNFYTGSFSYWILLTILVILKPAFSQTKKRNYERIIGTVAGGLLGILILHFIHDKSSRFWLLILFMLLTYSFARIRYVVSVFFMTPFILIMFSFTGHGTDDILIVKERILDTFIGAAIALLASYFILPNWESGQIRKVMGEMIQKNFLYLRSVVNYRKSDYQTQLQYRLARKDMYVGTSNLSSAFQRMLNEPKRKQQHVNEANKFILLNNLFASHVAALAYQMKDQDQQPGEQQVRELRKVFNLMKESYTSFTQGSLELEIDVAPGEMQSSEQQEVLVQLVQVSGELKKLSLKMNGVEG